MTLISKNLLFIFIVTITINLKAKTVEQYFIKISPNQELVNCGKLKVNKVKTNFDFFVKNNKVDIVSPSEALSWINDSILKEYPKDSKVLFFIHGFWGSLNFATHRTAKEFKGTYFKKNSSRVVAIIHVIWNANDIAYKLSLQNLRNSTKTLSAVFNNIDSMMTVKKSLMCHSMGNRFLHETLMTKKVNLHFDELILMAPDLDYRKFEKDHEIFTKIANSVDVFYHKKDKTLNMSKGLNKIERLGRLNKSKFSENINFIDCTDIKDIHSLSDSVMKHLYFLTSSTVKKQIENIVK